MNLTKKITLALGVLVAGAVSAQTTATSSASGLLGQRYFELSGGTQNISSFSDNAYSLGASVNHPMVPGSIDVGASYDYSWLHSGGFRTHANTLSAYGTYYVPMQGVKPFATAALGYQWTRARFFGDDDYWVWGAAVGVEIPAGPVTITPRIAYTDDFENSINSSQEWHFTVEGNYWVTPTTAIFASIGKTDVVHSSGRSWDYGIGARFKF